MKENNKVAKHCKRCGRKRKTKAHGEQPSEAVPTGVSIVNVRPSANSPARRPNYRDTTVAMKEIGSHQHLLAKRGLYHKLYLLQHPEQMYLRTGQSSLCEAP